MTSQRQFLRDYVLYVRQSQSATSNLITEIRNLHLQFSARKTIELEPNTCDIKIDNLTEDSMRQLTKKGTYVHLEAGYRDNLKQIFQGTVREANPTRNGTEWTMELKLSDGLVPLQDSVCYQSYPPGTPVAQAVQNVANTMRAQGASFNPEDIAAIPGQLADGFSHAGGAASGMRKLLDSVGYIWSIQDGKLQIQKRGEPAKGTVVLISSDSGLIDSPVHVAPTESKALTPSTPNHAQSLQPPTVQTKSSGRKNIAHVKAKFLLNGDVRCGSKIAIQSEYVNGVFLVDLVTHEGDSWAGDWSTSIEAVALPSEVIG